MCSGMSLAISFLADQTQVELFVRAVQRVGRRGFTGLIAEQSLPMPRITSTHLAGYWSGTAEAGYLVGPIRPLCLVVQPLDITLRLCVLGWILQTLGLPQIF
jgi:hypothetical protein